MEVVLFIVFVLFVIEYCIIVSVKEYCLTHKKSSYTYPTIHKCRCGGKPKVHWKWSPYFYDDKAEYEAEIKCPQCGFKCVDSTVSMFSSKGNTFITIPDTEETYKTNMKVIRQWNKINPQKCEECDQ